MIVLVDSSPSVMTLAIDGQTHLVKMPSVPHLSQPAPQLIGIILPEFETPFGDGFIGHVDAAFRQ